MLNGQANQQPSSRTNAAGAMNAGGLVIHTWATSVQVFLHKNVGDRFLGIHAAAVLLLVPVYGAFWQGYDLRPLMWFLPVYLGAVTVARLGIASRRHDGTRIHSFYTGFPRCMKARSKLSEVQFKRYIEPVLAASTGLTLCMMGERPLGVYLIIAGVCLFISVSMSELQFEQRAAAMNDQVIEQQYVAERFREMQGNGY
jgi:hypothetical protein